MVKSEREIFGYSKSKNQSGRGKRYYRCCFDISG
uniref:Uncharacterized protein n=1 Tax=Rhizophora mucronata TaxID=61149 RepID=A0A2P2PN25_RHIMU